MTTATTPTARTARSGANAWTLTGSRAPDLLFWLLFAGYLVAAGSSLGTLPYNPDEGVYIQTALDFKRGRTPVVDFLIHQPPLYPYLLQFFLPDTLVDFRGSLAPARWPSLVAHLLATLLLWSWLRRRDPLVAASGALLYLLPALHYYSLLAMPYAFMNLAATVALLLFVRATIPSRLTAALLLWLAWALRPLAGAYMAATAAWTLGELILSPGRRRAAVAFAAGGLVGALATWNWLQAITANHFAEILEGQLALRTSPLYLRIWKGFLPYDAEFVDSSLDWALREHAAVWLHWAPFRLFPIGLALLTLNLVPVWRRLSAPELPRLRALAALWLGIALVFNLGLWGGPIWDHYQVLYLLPWALIALGPTAYLYRWRPRLGERRLPVGAGVWAALMVGLALAPILPPQPSKLRPSPQLYHQMRRLSDRSTPLFTLDPVVNIVAGRPHGCIDNWFAYAPINGLDRIPVTPLRHLVVTDEEILTCLRTHPEIEIAISPWTTYAMSDTLRSRLHEFADRIRCLYLPSRPLACLERPRFRHKRRSGPLASGDVSVPTGSAP